MKIGKGAVGETSLVVAGFIPAYFFKSAERSDIRCAFGGSFYNLQFSIFNSPI
jgi:hypothetical protein